MQGRHRLSVRAHGRNEGKWCWRTMRTMKDWRRARVSLFLSLRCVGIFSHTLLEAPSRGSSPAATPRSSSPPPPSHEKIQVDSPSKAKSKGSKSTTKANGKSKSEDKTKTKTTAAVAAKGDREDVDMEEGDRVAAAEEDNDSGEDELEDVEERKAASKRCVYKPSRHVPMLNCHYSAQVALDRRDEMDVEGWKVGDP